MFVVDEGDNGCSLALTGTRGQGDRRTHLIVLDDGDRLVEILGEMDNGVELGRTRWR